MNLEGLLLIFLIVLGVVLLIQVRQQSARLQARETELGVVQREAQQIRATLRETEQLMATLSDAAFDALLVISAKRQITAINQAARDLFGVGAEAIGKTLMSISGHHELDAMVNSLLQGGEALESQFIINDRSFRVRGVMVGTALTLALQDVSELLRLTRARRDMVANFSHDMLNPVSSIRLLVDTLIQNFGRNPDRDKASLGKIAAETDNLQHMTRELIDLSVIESGQAIIRMVDVNLDEILQGAWEAMATQVEQKKLEWVNTIPSDLRVLADPGQTRRVITNLVHNSVKFTPSGGQIKFSATSDDNMVTVCVKDTGQGIPPQERTRIFERFYQVDTARSGPKSTSGTGLGLSIAKHIVEAQGGRIWAEAGIPTGASICFTLSLASNAKPTSK